tara:strand:+ start:302 stop:841 length:540 start_codon:yes stop_codon:yes gene_type:complete
MSPITSIEQLIECFDDAEPSEQASVLKRASISVSDFEKYASWLDGDYSRNCIARKDAYEMILICWDVDAKTPIHDHGGQHCWVLQVSGTITEKRFEQNEGGFSLVDEAELRAGKISYMNDKMGYHTLENNSKSRSMTLHIYANPINQCNVYNEEKSEFEIKEMAYDTEHKMVLNTASKK